MADPFFDATLGITNIGLGISKRAFLRVFRKFAEDVSKVQDNYNHLKGILYNPKYLRSKSGIKLLEDFSKKLGNDNRISKEDKQKIFEKCLHSVFKDYANNKRKIEDIDYIANADEWFKYEGSGIYSLKVLQKKFRNNGIHSFYIKDFMEHKDDNIAPKQRAIWSLGFKVPSRVDEFEKFQEQILEQYEMMEKYLKNDILPDFEKPQTHATTAPEEHSFSYNAPVEEEPFEYIFNFSDPVEKWAEFRSEYENAKEKKEEEKTEYTQKIENEKKFIDIKNNFRNYTKESRLDKKIALEAVRQNGLNILYCGYLRTDRDIVFEAIKENPKALLYVPFTYLKDEELFLQILQDENTKTISPYFEIFHEELREKYVKLIKEKQILEKTPKDSKDYEYVLKNYKNSFQDLKENPKEKEKQEKQEKQRDDEYER